MASRGQSIAIEYVAWNNGLNQGATGDAGNHTLLWVKDGVAETPDNAPTQVNAGICPGVYTITLTSDEANCNKGTLCGSSSTPNVAIFPVQMSFENLPTLSPGSPNGLATLDTNGLAPANVMRWLSQGLSVPVHTGVPIVEVAYSQIVSGYDGILAGATSNTVTFPTTDARGNSILDDSRYAYAVVKTLLGTGGGQIILTGAKSGARTFDVVSGMNTTCGNDTQYQILGTWRSQVQNRVLLDLTDPVPTSNTNQTVGDVLNQSLAMAAGKVVIDPIAKTMTQYARDNTTIVRVFNIDNVTAPLSRS